MAVSEGIDVASNENRANDTSVGNETWQRKDETESVEERLSMGENDVILNQDTSIVSSANSSHPSTNHSDSYGQVVLNDTTTHEPWAPPAAPGTTRPPPPPPPPLLPFTEIQTTPTPNSTSSSLLLSSLASSSKPLLETTMPTLILSAITKSSHPDQTQEAMKDSEGPPPRSSNTILQPANSPPAAAGAAEIRPTESSPPSEASSQSTARSSVLMAPTALPTALRNTTAPVLTTKTGKPRKRKLQSRDSEPGWAAESLTRPLASPDVCSNDPCGAGIACHPTNMTSEGFTCICPDNKKIRPGDNCTIETLNFTPSPQPIPSKAYKPNDQTTHSMVSPGSKSRNLLGVVLAAAVLAMMILLVTYWRRKTLFACLRNRHRDKKSGSSPGSLAKSSSLLTYNFASNPNYYAQAPDNLPLQTLAVQFIDKEQITFVGELGEGCFGKVYKGECGPRCPENLLANENGGSTPRVSTTVAVKVLKESASREAEADFLREVEIMSAFRHENILSLIGIVGTEPGGTPWMVFEYMPYGDLAEVLRSCNKQFYANDPPVKSLGKEDLLNMSVQIASGMEYLSSQHFIHRDLACRNCLVGENLTVKISDFGMSRDVYTCDYYKVGGTRMLPVRWMAPESIMYGKFTLESDVWSFGVVLWEIYSFGKQPYYGNSNEHVMKLILQGILLSPPDTCPAQVCDVMRKCWATEPHDRIKFTDILTSLTRILHGNTSEESPPLTPATPGPSITYSELCMHGDAEHQLDADQYLMPKKTERREYITVLSDV